MHQLHEEINKFLRNSDLGQNFPQSEWALFQRRKMHKMVLYPYMHDPSSQPSQLDAKYARKYQDSNQSPKVAKT
jgi:hypothetical protein